MVSPYRAASFQVTQIQNAQHDGLDLVGIGSKRLYSTVNGTVIRVGWENPDDHSQGFGYRVVIRKTGTNEYYYFGHMAGAVVSVGDTVSVGTRIGNEGNTGHSTGSHLHYCARLDDDKNKPLWIPSISGIPNRIGTYSPANPPDPDDFPPFLAAAFKRKE